MKRKFITNLLLLLFLNVLIKPFWIFGIDLTVQNLVGDESYGLYFSLLNFSMILNILLDFGITSYNNKNIAQHGQLLKKHISNIVGLKFLLAGIYAIVCMLAALIIGYKQVQLHLLAFLILNQFLISFTLYLRSNISGLHLFRTDSFLSVLDRSLMIIICSILLFTNITNHTFKIEWFVYSQSAAYLIASAITLGVVLARTGKLKFYFDRKFFIVFLRKSYPYALLILLMSFYNRIDSVMLERLLPDGKEQAGIYAHAFRLLDAVSMFGVLFAGLLLPIFARMLKQKEDIGPMVQFSFLLLFVPAIIISLSSGFYDQEIMLLLKYSHTELSASIFQLLMVSFLGIATTYIFGTLLTANGSIRQLNWMAVVGMALNIGLNLILIPHIQALGSAWASLATQLFTALAQTILAVVILKLTINYRLIGKLILFVSFVFLAGYFSRQINVWYLGYAVMIGASIAFAFYFPPDQPESIGRDHPKRPTGMRKKLTPEDLQNESEFELLTEVSHQKLREFVVEQITEEKYIILIYSIYQVIMMMLFVFLLTRGIVLSIKGHSEILIEIGLSLAFSLSALIVIHELLHAMAYLLTGARRISFGVIPKKFIFYALADRQVITPYAFHIVALTPFIVVKIICLAGFVAFYTQQLMYFFLSVMCLHSLFCAGDIAMLAFYRIHKEKEIYNFDNRSEGKTYFYSRKI